MRNIDQFPLYVYLDQYKLYFLVLTNREQFVKLIFYVMIYYSNLFKRNNNC